MCQGMVLDGAGTVTKRIKFWQIPARISPFFYKIFAHMTKRALQLIVIQGIAGIILEFGRTDFQLIIPLR